MKKCQIIYERLNLFFNIFQVIHSIFPMNYKDVTLLKH